MISHPITDLDGRTVDINDGAVTPPTGATLLNGTLRRTTDSPERAFRHIQITADDVTLDGLTIEGVRTHDPHYGLQPVYDPTREAQHGISIEGADHTRVTDVAVTNVYGDGIYIRGGAVDTIITNPTINLVGRTSITNVHSTGTRITGGYAYGAGLWLLNVESSGASQEVVDYRVTGLSTKLTGSRSWWLMSDGPDFNCHVQAVIQRPIGLSASARPRIDPCTENLVIW